MGIVQSLLFFPHLPLFIAVLPAIILMYIVYQQDKIEQEPPRLLLKLFMMGVASTLFASILEIIGQMLLMVVFADPYSVAARLVLYFVIVAGAEEGGKFLFLYTMTWRHPAFNYRFDGVVYSVFVTLGFAALENIKYMFDFGSSVLLPRAFLAIPLHCIAGVFMGHHYGKAKYEERRGNQGAKSLQLFLSLAVPILIHGFYDFAATGESVLISIVFFLFVIVVDIIAILSVKRYSREDTAL